jgi:hypothetical protein
VVYAAVVKTGVWRAPRTNAIDARWAHFHVPPNSLHPPMILSKPPGAALPKFVGHRPKYAVNPK